METETETGSEALPTKLEDRNIPGSVDRLQVRRQDDGAPLSGGRS